MFFYFAKVLWFLFQPSSIIVGGIIAGAALSRTRHKRAGARLLALSLVLLLIAGLTPFADIFILPLENRFPRPNLAGDTRPIAGIVVLGGAEDSRIQYGRELAGLNEAAERYTEAVALAHRYPAARVVFSGGSDSLVTDQPPAAQTAARLFEALGVARDRITLEDRSRDTYENAAFTQRLLKPAASDRWLLITSGWHMPRSMGCFRRVGFPVEAWPVDYRTTGRFDPLRWHGSFPDGLRRLDFAAREYAGLFMYYVSGRTNALFPAP